MAHCPSCGGLLGRDCFNPVECAWITQSMNSQYAVDDYIRQQNNDAERERNNQIELDYQAYVEAQYYDALVSVASIENNMVGRFLKVS